VYDKNGAARETTVQQPASLPCSTTTDVLGMRGAPGHTHGRTGQSLRNKKSGECALHGNQARWQLPGKEPGVEDIIGVLQFGVGGNWAE
jgi:hypothetical protein